MKCLLRVATPLLLVAIASALASDKVQTVSGHGGFPLTDAVTSMWGAVDEVVKNDKPLTFMIYFRGKPGWHDAKWQFRANTDEEPAVIKFWTDSIVLEAEYTRSSGTLRVFGTRIDIKDSNVVFVDRVDDAGHEVVHTLGIVDLRIPKEANPAVYVLQNNESVRQAVLGENP